MASTSHHRIFIIIAAAIAWSGADAFTSQRRQVLIDPRRAAPSSASLYAQPRGCAAKPFEKKKIAVFGAGGYLGAVTFGFLQRAASLYGTGISPGSSPRAICSTSGGPEALNKVLGPKFKLAFAGEDLVRLVDNTNVDHITERVKGFDAVILGTTYQLERRSVTLNTYEKNPNDKTYEMYLDEKYGAWENDVPSDDSDIHTMIFRNSVRACKDAGVDHLVVVETPRTVRPMDFMSVLEEEGVAYTYVRTTSELTKDINYTFEKGISNKLKVVCFPAGSSLTDVGMQTTVDGLALYREDVAALIVQSLMTLDWGDSRILEVTASPGSTVFSGYGEKKMRGLKFDKEWCPNSGLLAEVLSAF